MLRNAETFQYVAEQRKTFQKQKQVGIGARTAGRPRPTPVRPPSAVSPSGGSAAPVLEVGEGTSTPAWREQAALRSAWSMKSGCSRGRCKDVDLAYIGQAEDGPKQAVCGAAVAWGRSWRWSSSGGWLARRCPVLGATRLAARCAVPDLGSGSSRGSSRRCCHEMASGQAGWSRRGGAATAPCLCSPSEKEAGAKAPVAAVCHGTRPWWLGLGRSAWRTRTTCSKNCCSRTTYATCPSRTASSPPSPARWTPPPEETLACSSWPSSTTCAEKKPPTPTAYDILMPQGAARVARTLGFPSPAASSGQA